MSTISAIGGLKNPSLFHQGLPMITNPAFERLTLMIRFQGYLITVHVFAHVAVVHWANQCSPGLLWGSAFTMHPRDLFLSGRQKKRLEERGCRSHCHCRNWCTAALWSTDREFHIYFPRQNPTDCLGEKTHGFHLSPGETYLATSHFSGWCMPSS